MSAELVALTERHIEQAYEQQDVALLQKETIFVLNNVALNFPEVYADIFQYVKPVRVKIKREPDFLFREQYLSSIKKMLLFSARMFEEPLDFTEAKLFFDAWFYEVTSEGDLVCGYHPDVLVSITEAAHQLGVSRTMIYKYIDRGLEAVGEKGSQKIPRFVLEAWKNPAFAFQLQWIHQLKKARSQTPEQKLEDVNRKIAAFEKQYRGTFHHLYGRLSDQELDGMDEAVDLFDWKELEQEKRQLLERLEE